MMLHLERGKPTYDINLIKFLVNSGFNLDLMRQREENLE